MRTETIDGVVYYVWRTGDELPGYQPIGLKFMYMMGSQFYDIVCAPTQMQNWEGFYSRVIWPKLINDRAQHQRMIDEAYEHAAKKHPKFCGAFTHFMEPSSVKCPLRLMRKNVEENGYHADDILDEEKLEAVEAYLEGRLTECLHELAQCGAVVKRMMEYVQGEIDKDGQQESEVNV